MSVEKSSWQYACPPCNAVAAAGVITWYAIHLNQSSNSARQYLLLCARKITRGTCNKIQANACGFAADVIGIKYLAPRGRMWYIDQEIIVDRQIEHWNIGITCNIKGLVQQGRKENLQWFYLVPPIRHVWINLLLILRSKIYIDSR